MASNKPAEGLASVFSFAFVVYSHRKHSKYLGREFNHGPIARVFNFSWTLPQSQVFFLGMAQNAYMNKQRK